MNIKQKILSKLPKRLLFESLLESLDKNKLYSKKFFLNKLGVSYAYVDRLFSLSKNSFDKIEINNKTYFGDKKLIQQIKEKLFEEN